MHVLLDSDNLVASDSTQDLGAGSYEVIIGGALPTPAGTLVSPAAATLTEVANMFAVLDSLLPRPAAPTVSHEESLGVHTVKVGICDGASVIEVIDVSGDEIVYSGPPPAPAVETVFEIQDAGAYQVNVTPPAPQLPATLDFEI